MYLVTSIVCVVIAAVLGVIVFFTRTEAFTSNKTVIGWVTIICAIIMILEIIETIVSPLFRYQRYAYGLTDEEVQIKEGCRSAAFIKSKFLPVRLTACLALPKLKSLLPAET